MSVLSTARRGRGGRNTVVPRGEPCTTLVAMSYVHDGMCEQCGRDAKVQHVSFAYNVGLLVMRFHKTIQGALCKSCASSTGWKYFLVSFFFGWWGVISFFFNFVCLATNVSNLLKLRNYPPEA
jgi:hypothetical protein